MNSSDSAGGCVVWIGLLSLVAGCGLLRGWAPTLIVFGVFLIVVVVMGSR